MKFLYFLIRASRKAVTISIIAGVLSGATSIGLIAAINSMLNSGGRSVIPAWAFIALCVFALATKVASELILIRLAQSTTYNLRMQLWQQVLTVPLRRHEELGAHRILTALTGDIFTITNFVTFVPNIFMSMTVVLGCLIYMAWLSWVALGLTVGFMILGIGTYQIPVRKARRYFRIVRQQQDSIFKMLRGVTEGIKELKLHRGRRKTYTEKFQETALSQQRNNILAGSIFVVAASWGTMLFLVLIGVLIYTLPLLRPFDAEVLTGAALALLFMRAPLESLLGALPNMGTASVAVTNVQELGISLSESSEPDMEVAPSATDGWSNIVLSGVTHTYHSEKDGDEFTLGPIDMVLRPAEMIFLAGGNGSGKTTLAKVLAGLYAPENGAILFDGQPVTDQNREHYRQHFSAVFSDFYIFDSLLGHENINIDAEARGYLAQLQIDHKLQIKDGEFSTTDLSQGQRKRLALLAAYLEDRPICIFDEWAADQDPVFRNIFYHELLPELKARGKTLFVITHDDRYYHLADRFIKLDYGKVEQKEPVCNVTA